MVDFVREEETTKLSQNDTGKITDDNGRISLYVCSEFAYIGCGANSLVYSFNKIQYSHTVKTIQNVITQIAQQSRKMRWC